MENILLWVPEWDGSVPMLKPKSLRSSKQILSPTTPRGINIHRFPNPKKASNPASDDGMMVETGKIITGLVEKKAVGASRGGLTLKTPLAANQK